MIDILFAHSNSLKYDQKQIEKMRPYAPLATLYVASYVRSQGYTVALFDATFAEDDHEFVRALERDQPRFVVLYEDNFNFLSKMCLSSMRETACRMSEAARAAGAIVIAAGSDVSDHPATYFAHGVHVALIGEADHTLLELLATLTGRLALDDWRLHDNISPSRIADLQSSLALPGMALPDPNAPNGVRYTTKRTNERHPDVFPFPAWDLLDVERYRAAWTQAHGYYSLNMVSTRGCPFHCNWCAKPIWGQRYAMRSPANVAAEMALIKHTLRPDHIWFADDIFGLRPEWVAEFGREVANRDAKIPFMIQSRADLMTEQAVAGLAQAGCIEVWMGAESGSQKILDAMDKGILVDDIVTARARLKAAGIKAGFFIQFGYPGETFADIMATVQMVRDTLPDDIGISVSYPLPGTRFHTLVKDQLKHKTNWRDSNDLAMMFQGTYQSPFYRKLHQVLHHDLEAHQQIQALTVANGQGSDAAPPPIVQIQSLLTQLNDDWLALGQMEQQYRNSAPTQLTKSYIPLAAPDLSKEWN